MDLTSYVDTLHRELVVAAEAGGMDAERLGVSLESATRLVLLEALSAAADEITRDLAPGAVEVRLRGREPEFVVTPPPAAPPDDVAGGVGGVGDGVAAPSPDVSMTSDEGEESGTARITLRLPTHLKPRIDEAANRAGLSVNAWLVRAVSAALRPDGRSRPDERRPGTQFGGRYRGWVR